MLEHSQNQLIYHFALKTCHISSQNVYIFETKLGGEQTIGLLYRILMRCFVIF